MAGFADSYLGRLRAVIGSRLVLMPGARLVLHRADGRVYLQRRSDFGRWGFISGGPEAGESLTAMIVREAQEEAGIAIATPAAFGFSSNPALETLTYPNGDRCQFFAVMYACDAFTGEPGPADSESTEAAWFDPGQLPEDRMPSVTPTLAAFARWRATGQFQLLD